MTPLMNAIKVKNIDILECVLDKTDKYSLAIANLDGDTPLHYAIKSADERIVEKVSEKSPPKVHYMYNNEGLIPLTMSKISPNPKVSEAIISDLNSKGITESLVMFIESNSKI
jgi:ankyrin repeat protein